MSDQIAAAKYRQFWRDLFSDRVNATAEQASARASYGKRETEILVADAVLALDIRQTDALLDIGCAKGLMGKYLRPLVSRYVGLDYVAAFYPTVVGDAIGLPFRDATFDKVLLSGVLLCVPPVEHAQVIREMRRVTRPGGLGFISSNPFQFIHDKCAVFERDALLSLAMGCGWERAWITPISPSLEQAPYYFDMVVAA